MTHRTEHNCPDVTVRDCEWRVETIRRRERLAGKAGALDLALGGRHGAMVDRRSIHS